MYIVTIDTDKCEACGECVENCPSEALVILEEDGKKYAMFAGAGDDCIGCLSCEAVCEEGSITITEM